MNKNKLVNKNKSAQTQAKKKAHLKPMPLASDMVEKTFNVRLIDDKKVKNVTDITYNETALKILLLDVESLLESYALTRLSLIRTAINKENATIKKVKNDINEPTQIKTATETEIKNKQPDINKVEHSNINNNVDDALL